jgi:hypothetical protein
MGERARKLTKKPKQRKVKRIPSIHTECMRAGEVQAHFRPHKRVKQAMIMTSRIDVQIWILDVCIQRKANAVVPSRVE